MKYLLLVFAFAATLFCAAQAQGLVGMSGEGLPRVVQSDEAYRNTLQFTYWRDVFRTVSVSLAVIALFVVCRFNLRHPIELLRKGVTFVVLLPVGIYLGAVQLLQRVFP